VVASQAQLQVLEMLVAEVPESDLLDALRRIRESGEDDPAAVERLTAAALQIHRSRLEDRRRVIGLAVLGDTAVDLAARRELDGLLSEICRRARMLRATDVDYITLADGAETYVRATDGIVSESFRAMRIPLGVWLGGLVARTGEPAFTADYNADARLSHLPDVDGRVADEQLRAIAAVPLRRGDEILGVVMSGSRSVRRFDPQELGLFASWRRTLRSPGPASGSRRS
jgi:GAF domain-containing protein